MAEEPETVPVQDDEGDDGDENITPGYKAPKQVDLKKIQELDADDESLVKYKETLLGSTKNVLDDGGNNVIVKTMVFAPSDHDEMPLDLTGDLSQFKKTPLVIKEGANYKIHIKFRVQREIVSGLRYNYAITRKGMKVDSGHLMVGSYRPQTDEHIFKTPSEDMPKGLISRGNYHVKSKFTDDDKNIYLQWEWSFNIKKDWES